MTEIKKKNNKNIIYKKEGHIPKKNKRAKRGCFWVKRNG